MAAIIATAQNYWISTSALTITLNALGEANRVQASVASGAQIMCYIRGVDGLDFDEGHNYRRWPLTVSPTFFNTNTHKYLYVVIPRTTAIGTQAMVWFPSQLLDINGCAIDEEGEPAEQVGNPDYYYIWLQGIISSSGASGNTPRTWEQQPQTGTLATDEAVSPTGGYWYQWDAISQTVTFLKDIWMDAASTFRNLILGGKTLTGVAVDDTTPDDSTTHVATPAYVKSVSNDRYLRKDQDDFTPFSIGIGTNLNVDGEVIADWMQSSEYTGDGMMDKGYKLWYDATTGRSKLVIDDLVARGKFTVNELESRIWTYAGGNMIFSGAGSTIFFVEYLDANDNLLGYTHINSPWLLNGRPLLSAMVAWSKRRKVMRSLTPAERARVAKFRCYEYSDNGTMQTRNWWHTDDLAFCQTLNHVKDKVNSDGSYSGSLSNTVYHRLVKKIGTAQIEALDDGQFYDYVELSNISGEYDPSYNDWPAAGDTIVQRGNRTDSSRRSMVTIEVTGDTRGLKVYDNIMGWYADTAHGEHPNGVRYTYIGYNESTGRANLEAFGDAYIGSIDKTTTYIKFDEQQQKLDIKARISAQSTMPVDGVEKTMQAIFSGINQQIDSKIETWQQASNPAADWTTDTEKAKHVGDLWMDTSTTGGKKTYIYKDKGAGANPRYDWEAQDVPQEVFDGIDGKAAAYASWGAWGTKLHLRDLLIPDTTFTHDNVEYKAGKVYRCTSLNPITFSEINYTDDTKANEVARGLAQEITDRGQAIAAAQQAAAQDATNKVNAAKQELEQSINSVDTAHTTAEGALADGYIDNDEREALKAVLKSLEAEFADVTASYSVVYNNALLNDTTEKTALYNAYTALVAANNNVVSAFTSFINAPATTKYEKGDSEGSYTYTPAGQSQPITVNLTTLQTTFNTCAAAYQSALESANAKIQALIKAIADNALNGVTAMQYIKNAIKGTTVTQGGLMLTSAIFLRQLKPNGDPNVDSDYVTWSGINGTTPQGDRSIAAWFGGDMEDKEAAATPDPTVRYAKSLFRMDGSGYVADGGLSWDYNNQGKTVVTLNGDVVKAANYYLNGTDITAQLSALFDMFEKVNVAAQGQTPHYMIHAKYGLYAEGDVQALGYDPEQGGGGGGASVLYDLNDVSPNAAHNAVLGIIIDDQNPQGDGYVLTYDYNSKHWIAAPAAETYRLPQATAQALGGIKIGYTPGAGETRNYAVVLDNDGKAYVNVPWVSGSFGTEGSDNVQITLGGTTKTVLTSHQSLSDYATQQWVNNKGYITSSGSCSYANSAGAVAWSNVSGRPTAVSSFTNDSGYITSSGSCNYANSAGSASSAGNADTVDGYHASALWRSDGGTWNPKTDIKMNANANGCEWSFDMHRNGYTGCIWHVWDNVNGSILVVDGATARVGIGTTSPSHALHVSGNIGCNYLYASSDVQVTSDERRKDVIGNVQLSVEQIAQMPSVLFRWKKGFGDDLIHVGTIAQSWEKVLPAAVGIGTDDDRTRSFSYSAAAYAMAHADACEIVALKKRVSELEAELKRYKSA